ncbi:alpha/beta fold hydrolase [Streptomyces sp. 1331.2]|uniref:alpha/beta fold hydrolase n=1 Tax=Streptomyces sp. 1331.2 TaxID=1938835 RepID=UPI000BC4D91C|nr:alpha/beta hydrolase [Streptomyces sp. 1331.2]SOB80021.1 Pimeloyl-ACP methyl ester carboxylesterase [Streptomyces sp. 1331.2]
MPARTAPFLAAYDALLARWPVPVEALTVRTAHGTTRINACGPRDGRPLVLLHGGGATSAMWFANAAAWAEAGHRVLAVDLIGDPGRSVHDGVLLDGVPGLLGWLDAVLDGLGVPETDVCGHSYGGWIALEYALHAPARVGRLALLDPTQCFAGFRPGYLLRALPLFLPGRTPDRARSYLDWETGGSRLDADWRELYALGYADFPATRVVTGPRPTPAHLRTLTSPVLALLAAGSRTHDPARVAEAARRTLPAAEVAIVPDTAHHNLPMAAAPEVNQRLVEFLSGARA